MKPYYATEAARRAADRERSDTHALVARTRGGGFVKLEEFPSYDEALTAWAAATECLAGYDKLVVEYAVRSVDDPTVKKFAPHRDGKLDDYYRSGYVYAKLREARRKEVGATVRLKLDAAHEGKGLSAIANEIRESLLARGIKTDRHEVESAIKSRIILGRCKAHDRTKRAFWVKKSEGPLHQLRCPDCGHRLDQTSLALNAEFQRMKP